MIRTLQIIGSLAFHRPPGVEKATARRPEVHAPEYLWAMSTVYWWATGSREAMNGKDLINGSTGMLVMATEVLSAIESAVAFRHAEIPAHP